MRKPWVLTIAVLIVVFGGIFGGKLYAQHRAASAAAHRQFPAASVATATAREESWNPEVDVVGSLEGVSGTEITAQIAGNVTRIAFQSGAKVKQGELLVGLDDSNQLALLHADEAKLQLANATLARTRKLYAAHAASQLDLQTDEATAGMAAAAVQGDRATLKKLNIVAPFSGVLGIRNVSLGQYVSPGTSIVNLQSWNPLLLDFSLPQSSLADLRPGSAVAFAVDAYPGKTFAGHLTAISSRIDPATRNVDLQATIGNPDDLLRPGLYGHVTLAVGSTLHGIVVPATALTFSTFGDSVYVVKQGPQGATAHAVVVQVRNQRDGKALLAGGVQPGDVVVTAGQNKLRDGAPVTVDNRVQP